MRISFEITPDEAITAISYELSYGEKINSRAKFRKVLNLYFYLHGSECMDDHITEHRQHREQAQAICNKYFHA